MIPNYELIIRRDGEGWHLSFTQGSTRKEVNITSLEEIEPFLKKHCEGYNDERT